MKKETPIEERKFIRSFTCKKEGEQDIRFISQPYITGMYVCIEQGSGRDQLNIPHNKFKKFSEGLVKNLKEKLKGSIEDLHEALYVSFIKKEEIIDYEILK